MRDGRPQEPFRRTRGVAAPGGVLLGVVALTVIAVVLTRAST